MFSYACHTNGDASLAIGSLVIADDGRRALDPDTQECYQLPEPSARLLAADVLIWTGRDVISLSGVRSLAGPVKRAGLAYRPPRWVRSSESASATDSE